MPGPLIVSLAGKKLLPKEKELLSHKKVGGVVLFRENFDKEADEESAIKGLKALVSEIRACNRELLIMVDHEGGKVWRFEKGFTKLPPAKELGELYDKDKKKALELAYQRGAVMAQELLDCDIDMSLAPVVDLDGESNVIGKLSRAFHKDPKIVAEIAEQFIRGMNDKGMPATLKHFPDHGSCLVDSHVAKPVDDRSMQDLQKGLIPYKALVTKGLNFAIMPAHVTYPAVDPKNTAGFSSVWLQDCLRRSCGFEGVVMSDCLLMKGADVGSVLERIQAAQEAGCDFSMYTHQHGSDLDKLLSILDQIPDTKEGIERRKILAQSVKKRSDSLKLLPQSSPVLAQASTLEMDSKEDVERQIVSVLAQSSGSTSTSESTTEKQQELGERETRVMLPQFSSVLAQTSASPPPRPYSILNTETESDLPEKEQESEVEKEKAKEKLKIG